MAQVNAYTSFNMNNFPFPTGAETYPTLSSTHIQGIGGGTEANYYGTGFSVVGDDVVDGTLFAADYSVGGILQFEVTGLNHDAVLVWDYLVAQDAVGLFTYTLSGADTFICSAEADVIYSYAGNDSVTLDAGDDIAYGGDGADTLRGGDGNDQVLGELGNDVLKGGDGSDYLDGGSGADILSGGAGSDYLVGGGGADYLKGGGGNDILVGSGGGDRLEGRGGDDTLSGGSGTDILVGGTGDDCFWFYKAGAKHVDTISDFTGAGSSEGDVICLNDIYFTILAAGPLAEGNFVSGSAPSAADADDYVLYDTGTGALYFDADGNGPGTALQFATVAGSPDELDFTDFEVV